jgi:PleD family two-component response regulator
MIMVIAGDPAAARRITDALPAADYRIDQIDPSADASVFARATRPDAIVVHSSGFGASLLEVCQEVRERVGVDTTTPLLVLLEGEASRADRLGCLRDGAWDVLRLPDNLSELSYKLASFSQLKRKLDFAQATSLLDPATQVYNTRGMLLRAEELVAVAARYEHPLACAVFAPAPAEAAGGMTNSDAQRFTDIVISTVREVCRGSDLVGRLGPSQFAVIAPETGAHQAWHMIRRVLLEADRQVARQQLSAGRLRAGYWAASDVRHLTKRPAEILVHAATALRSLWEDDEDERVRQYTPDLNGSPTAPSSLHS